MLDGAIRVVSSTDTQLFNLVSNLILVALVLILRIRIEAPGKVDIRVCLNGLVSNGGAFILGNEVQLGLIVRPQDGLQLVALYCHLLIATCIAVVVIILCLVISLGFISDLKVPYGRVDSVLVLFHRLLCSF